MNAKPNAPFNPMIPNDTRMKCLKLETPRREIQCLHKNVKTSHSPGCVKEFYCIECGAWLGDKDVS
jgi:hypothetical protein